MGARVIRKRATPKVRRKQEFRALAMISSAVALPMILAYILIAADMRTDLSDLKPTQAMADKSTTLIGWPDLETPDGRPAPVEQAGWHSQSRIRMLGYMMDGYEPSRDGELVQMFILMPEAGQFFHPAHRISNEMVEIWLERPSPFKFRRLLWVFGVLARTPGQPDREKASYAMNNAVIEPAEERDITRWFKP